MTTYVFKCVAFYTDDKVDATGPIMTRHISGFKKEMRVPSLRSDLSLMLVRLREIAL